MGTSIICGLYCELPFASLLTDRIPPGMLSWLGGSRHSPEGLSRLTVQKLESFFVADSMTDSIQRSILRQTRPDRFGRLFGLLRNGIDLAIHLFVVDFELFAFDALALFGFHLLANALLHLVDGLEIVTQFLGEVVVQFRQCLLLQRLYF